MRRLMSAFGLFTFLAFVTVTFGQLCTPLVIGRVTSSDEFDCRISSQTDFDIIPPSTTILHLAFTQEYANTFLTGAGLIDLSQLSQLRELSVNVRYLPRLRNETFHGVSQVERLMIYHTSHSSEAYSLEVDVRTFVGLTALTQLYASTLGISYLPSGVFDPLVKLEHLDLHLNNLEDIDSGVFANCCTGLFSVSLARNRLRDVAGIRTLSKLRILDLHGNNITVLSQGAFVGLEYLDDVNLASNKISDLVDGAFFGLGKLQKLYLDKNTIGNMTAATFNGLANVTELNLQDNALRVLPASAFSSLIFLTDLLISNNYIEVIEPGSFHGLSQLIRLQLNNNGITQLNGQTFGDLRSLERLDLSNNFISNITADSFRSLPALAFLNLGGNLLMTLPEGVFQFLSSLSTLILSNNPWSCDCQLHWLAALVIEGRICNASIVIGDLNGTTCASPESDRGSHFVDAFSNTSCSSTGPDCAEEATTEAIHTTAKVLRITLYNLLPCL